MLKKVVLHSVATALASIVLPVPLYTGDMVMRFCIKSLMVNKKKKILNKVPKGSGQVWKTSKVFSRFE